MKGNRFIYYLAVFTAIISLVFAGPSFLMSAHASTDAQPVSGQKAPSWKAVVKKIKGGKKLTAYNGSLTASQKSSIEKCILKKKKVGFVAINTKTGKAVAYNAKKRIFSASSIKAPFIAALCKYKAPKIGSYKKQIRKIIVKSNNRLYDKLVRKYGKKRINKFAKSVGAKLKWTSSTSGYAKISARDLASLWGGMNDYMFSDRKNAKLLRNSFSYGNYMKVGFMEKKSWCGPIYTIGGVEDGIIYAIVTNYHGRSYKQYNAMWELRAEILSAVE